jgi:hypothetical protein
LQKIRGWPTLAASGFSSNPAKPVPLRREKNSRLRYPPAEETRIRVKLKKLYPDNLPDFDLALNTGMRRG